MKSLSRFSFIGDIETHLFMQETLWGILVVNWQPFTGSGRQVIWTSAELN